MTWSIDQYNDPFNYDDEGREIPWGIKEVFDEAHEYEGIIITLDGQRHNIPFGGGIVRRPSAQAFGEFKFHAKPPESAFAKFMQGLMDDLKWNLTRQFFEPNILFRYLKEGPPEPKPEPSMPEGLVYKRCLRNVNKPWK